MSPGTKNTRIQNPSSQALPVKTLEAATSSTSFRRSCTAAAAGVVVFVAAAVAPCFVPSAAVVAPCAAVVAPCFVASYAAAVSFAPSLLLLSRHRHSCAVLSLVFSGVGYCLSLEIVMAAEMTPKIDAAFDTGSNTKSENVSVQVTSIRLNKDNYLSWSAALEIGITSRGRLPYITGEKPAPSKTDPSWATWALEDSQVKVYTRKKKDVVEDVDVTNLNPVSSPNEPSPMNEELPIALRKGTRSCTSHPIQRFVSYAKLSKDYKFFLTSLSMSVIPRCVENAREYPKWLQAMTEEMDALAKNKAWEVVDIPKGTHLVGSK
ncbi:hypothetical protein EJ110_NYTH14912 [Nymphaea thermarum]|nr:hypothetical protein EJ110_NYTH14912 [Nymphaea thermarum]